MFEIIPQAFPEQWREVLQFLARGVSWIPDLQTTVLSWAWSGDAPLELVVKRTFLFLPTLLFVAALWCFMASLYTVPFRSGRGGFLQALLISWWDVGRMTWFYWAGLVRFIVVLVGWAWGLLRLAVEFAWNVVKGLVASPFALLDWSSRKYFRPGVPWIAFLLILLWSALEATIFTFTLRPTLTEVLTDLTGAEPNPALLIPILWLFLFILISGSFACIQLLAEALGRKQRGQILQMAFVEFFVMFFEVMFLYRELIDAITPWIAQQTGFQLGFFSTLALASFGWVGVRAMTWFLFGRFGTPALLGVLARQNIAGEQPVAAVPPPAQPDFWKGPMAALKAETEWFKKEAREVFELISLPVLQLPAAAINFAVVMVTGRPTFTLPFRSLDQVLAGTPLFGGGKPSGPGASA